MSRILVVGASGLLGRALVAPLRAAGHALRLMSRDPARLAASAAPDVETVQGDLRDAASLADACAGCGVVVAAAHGMTTVAGDAARVVDDRGHRALIAAARAAGARRFVLVSAREARPDHPVDVFRAKHAVEQCLRAGDLPHVVLRPTAFLETWSRLGASWRVVVGDGRNRLNLVSVEDVARAVVWACGDDAPSRATIDVVGPQDFALLELARAAADAAGGRVVRVPLRLALAPLVVLHPFAPAFCRRWRALLRHVATVDQSAAPAPSEAPAATTTLRDVLARRAVRPTAPSPRRIPHGPL